MLRQSIQKLSCACVRVVKKKECREKPAGKERRVGEIKERRKRKSKQGGEERKQENKGRKHVHTPPLKSSER